MTVQREMQERCSRWVRSFTEAVEPLGMEEVGAALRADLVAALKDERVQLVVCGEWSTGKSTLINALLATPDLLPTDVAPTTSYVTVIGHGDTERFEARREDVVAPLTREAFRALTAESAGDGSITSLRVEVPLPAWRSEPVLVVDTPGLSDLTRTRSEVTLKYVPQADAILLVVDAVEGVKASVVEFLRDHLTSREQRRVIAVLNRKDMLNDPADVARRLESCRAALRDVLPDITWVATDASSAVRALRQGDAAGADTGVPSLREAIVTLVRRDRVALLAQRFVRVARGRHGDALSRHSAEEASLALGLAEAEKRLVDFRRKTAETSRINDEAFRKARQLIESEVQPWLSAVPERVRALQAALLAQVTQLEDLDALRDFINTDQLGASIARELRMLCDGLDQRLTAAVERAGREVLSEQLVTPDATVLDAEGLSPAVDSIFRHVPKVVVQLVEVLLADLLVPGGIIAALAARLGLGALLKQLKHLDFIKKLMPTELVKSQLRSAVEEGLADCAERVTPVLRSAASDSVDRVVRGIQAALEQRAAAVEAGLEEARAQLSLDRARTEARRALLTQVRERLTMVGTELDELAR